MTYNPIIGTLGYIMSPDKKKVLLVKRIARKFDDHFGKYNGLGGKMHRDEDPATCMRRELLEEAEIECTKMTLRGIINWTGFGAKEQDWLGFIFRIDEFTGTPPSQNPEGTLEWIPIEKMMELPIWEGDRHFLPLVFDNDPRVFYGYMPYEKDKSLGWSYVRI